jgi:hypothetical protein
VSQLFFQANLSALASKPSGEFGDGCFIHKINEAMRPTQSDVPAEIAANLSALLRIFLGIQFLSDPSTHTPSVYTRQPLDFAAIHSGVLKPQGCRDCLPEGQRK